MRDDQTNEDRARAHALALQRFLPFAIARDACGQGTTPRVKDLTPPGPRRVVSRIHGETVTVDLPDSEIHELQVCLWCIYSVDLEDTRSRYEESNARWRAAREKEQAALAEIVELWAKPWRDFAEELRMMGRT